LALPEQRHSVGWEILITGYNRQTFNLRLGDNEAIKRIAMMPGQRDYSLINPPLPPGLADSIWDSLRKTTAVRAYR